ncbi:hypothetical protein Asp14428_43310 [Actinoplanes sp. NBRC 14428]|nr:hypothetical protein Asp14428_43310 [Actinoplanes sp. NBRC 14428]
MPTELGGGVAGVPETVGSAPAGGWDAVAEAPAGGWDAVAEALGGAGTEMPLSSAGLDEQAVRNPRSRDVAATVRKKDMMWHLR